MKTYSAKPAEIEKKWFLIDADGRVRYRVRGNPGWEYEYTRSVIDELISEASTSARLNSVTNEANP